MWYEKLFFVCTPLRYLTFKAFFKCIVGFLTNSKLAGWQLQSESAQKLGSSTLWVLPGGRQVGWWFLFDSSYTGFRLHWSEPIFIQTFRKASLQVRGIFFIEDYITIRLYFQNVKSIASIFTPWQPCRKVTPQLPGRPCGVAREAWHGGSFSAVGDIRGSGSIHKTNYTNYSTPKCEQ